MQYSTKRYISSSGPFGGGGEWVDWLLSDGVIDLLSGDEATIADRLTEKSTHVLIDFNIIDIKQGDKVFQGDNVYRVTFVDNPMGMDRQLEVLLERVNDDEED